MEIRRVPADLAGGDYVDGFEAVADRPDDRTAEEFARAAFDGAPAALRAVIRFAQAGVLRLGLGPMSSPDHVFGWAIRHRTDDVIELVSEGPLLSVELTGRRTGPASVQLVTRLRYRTPLGRALWFVVGPVHRATARYLLRRTTLRG